MSWGTAVTVFFLLSILGNVLDVKGIADGPLWLTLRAAIGILFLVSVVMTVRSKNSSPEN